MRQDSISGHSTKAGQFIKKEILETENITVTELANRLGVVRQTISGILNGRREISADLAFALADKFGRSPSFYKGLNNHEEATAAKTTQTQSIRLLLDLWRSLGSRILTDGEIKDAWDCHLIGIKPFSKNHLQGVTYDLRIFDVLVTKIIDENEHNEDLANGNVVIEPGQIATVKSMENLTIPSCICGQLGEMTDLVKKGIQVIHGIGVDPGYRGWIYAMLKNIGNRNFIISRETPFLSLKLTFLLTEPLKLYDGVNQNRDRFSENEKETIRSKVTHSKENALDAIDTLKNWIENSS